MVRGYNSTAEMMPNFLHIFDVDNGLLPYPVRTQSITALQTLFLMNSPLVEQATADFGKRLAKDFKEDPEKAVELGYKMALGRSPSHTEKQQLLSYLQDCKECNSSMAGAEKLAWFLINLDEFIFVR
jgi:hypothetical protein